MTKPTDETCSCAAGEGSQYQEYANCYVFVCSVQECVVSVFFSNTAMIDIMDRINAVRYRRFSLFVLKYLHGQFMYIWSVD